MIQVTYQKLIEFVKNAADYLAVNSDERSKLTYALTKLTERYKKHIAAYNDEVRDLRVKYASVDAAGDIIENETAPDIHGKKGIRYAYKPEQLKVLDEALRTLAQKQVMVDKTHIVEIPLTIDPWYIQAFTPFVFAEMDEQKEEELYLSLKQKPKPKPKF